MIPAKTASNQCVASNYTRNLNRKKNNVLIFGDLKYFIGYIGMKLFSTYMMCGHVDLENVDYEGLEEEMERN